VKLIERYGISHFKTPTSFFNNGLNEWQLTLNLKNKKEVKELATEIHKKIRREQVEQMYLQRTVKKRKETKVKLVAGKLQIWIMGVSNVQDATEAKVKLTMK
jgi:peroxiredoxin family protein